MNNTDKVKVRNRSNSVVVYTIEDLHVRREFVPGEEKLVPREEILALGQKQGGAYLLQNSLYIEDEATVEQIPINIEPEYYLDEAKVIDLLQNGSLDMLLDCLEFAPNGVIDLVQKQALALPLTDTRKIAAIKEKTGFDVSRALIHKEELERDNEAEGETVVVGTARRTAPDYRTAKR